jgi:quinolinate synthase
MFQSPLSQDYLGLSTNTVHARILAAKEKLGKRLVILGHHYQRDEIICYADYRGDSYKLAKEGAALPDAEFIVFCGVHFMAESANILAQPNQKVILPNLSAGCSMADMANIFQVRACWKALEKLGIAAKTVPVTYINSAANLKSFVGEHGGSVCTSSNCPAVLKWAIGQGEKILFFPDQHLGRNTALALGYLPEEMVVWDPNADDGFGGNDPEALKMAKFLLWKGHCSVHGRFTVNQIAHARQKYPDVRVVVHPECRQEVVAAADDYGSTERIQKLIRESPNGSIWAVGTEINQVNRLAEEQKEFDKIVFCLDPIVCPCSTMYRIAPPFLLWVLENLVEGTLVNEIIVPDDIAKEAIKALNKMIEIAG